MTYTEKERNVFSKTARILDVIKTANARLQAKEETKHLCWEFNSNLDLMLRRENDLKLYIRRCHGNWFLFSADQDPFSLASLMNFKSLSAALQHTQRGLDTGGLKT